VNSLIKARKVDGAQLPVPANLNDWKRRLLRFVRVLGPYANPAYRPVIDKVQYDDGAFTLTGRQLNGPSDTSAYGDDVQSNENYPIVRLQNSAGLVFYCRSRDWTSTGVGNIARESVRFTLNPAVVAGTYQLTVSAAGISSAAVELNVTAEELGGDR
jgi:hypothetical protein